MEALKLLYVKIMNVVILLEREGPKSKKKEEHKKELEEYSKVFCNFLSLEEATRERILTDLKK